MSIFHLNNGTATDTTYFCQFCAESFSNRKKRAYHMHKDHVIDLQMAVDEAYSVIHANLAPRSLVTSPVETPGSKELISPEVPEGDVLNTPVWTIQTPISIEDGLQVFTIPPNSTLGEGSIGTDPPIPILDTSDQIVELRWDSDISSTPTIHYPPTDPWSGNYLAPTPAPELIDHVSLVQTPEIPTQGTEGSPGPDICWQPRIATNGNEPQWVVDRNIQLQLLLDSAAPLFEYGKSVGDNMCSTCIEHFDKLTSEVEQNCSKEELMALKARNSSLIGP
jgi:hypothetical protein